MKKIFVLLFILLLCGCHKELTIETVVENKNNIKVALVYPTTGIHKFDKIIKNYVDKTYQGFQTDYENPNQLAEESELNMDYQYWVVNNRYHNVILTTFIDSAHLAHPINEMESFVFDEKENKVITLENFLGKENVKKLIPMLKQKLITEYKDCILTELLDSEISYPLSDVSFTFTNDNLTIYFNPYLVTAGYCGIIHVSFPLSTFGINFPKLENKPQVTTSTVNKIIDPDKKAVAITFDDGPSKYTKKILDLLQKEDSNATFFVLGNKVKSYEETIRDSISLGNEIGNHSYNHKWLTRLSVESFQEQIEKTQNIIKEVSGYTPIYLRPTYGSVNSRIRNNTSLEIVLWNVDSLDWKIKNSERIANRVLDDVEDLDIILFHDTHLRTVEALEIIIPKLKEEGYQLVTVSELMAIKKIRKIN